MWRLRSRWPDFLLMAVVLYEAVGCKDTDTLTGLLPTATPVAATTTPLPATATPAPATATAAPTTTRTPRPLTPTPSPQPTPSNLSGAWQGTIAYHDPDWWWPCGDPGLNARATAATATLVQNGSSVTGTITSSCFSSAAFVGTLEGGHLFGTIQLRMGVYVQTGSSTGQGNESQIHLDTPVFDVHPSPCPGVASCEVGGFDVTLHR